MNQKMIKNRIWTAPLAGISDSPFRMVNRHFGAKYAYSEMVSVEGIWRKHKNTKKLLSILNGDTPLIVQLFGANPESFYKSVKEMEDLDHISEININAGCPVKKVVKNGSGSALMTTPELLGEIVRSVRSATTKKVSVKLRSGWRANSINAKECAIICESAGVDEIVVHPRTADMFFTGSSDWNVIKDVKGAIKVPVIGNGDVNTLDDAKRMMETTGCDGVMVGRALVGNPWFFTGSPKKIDDDFIKIVLWHMDLAKEFYGDIRAYKLMKKHLIYYSKNVDTKGHDRKKYFADICHAKNFDDERKVAEDFFRGCI
jgi:tRNA-dihydrouridine synthase B